MGAQHNLKNRVFKDSKDLGLRINWTDTWPKLTNIYKITAIGHGKSKACKLDTIDPQITTLKWTIYIILIYGTQCGEKIKKK